MYAKVGTAILKIPFKTHEDKQLLEILQISGISELEQN